jgi:hypothetical protein
VTTGEVGEAGIGDIWADAEIDRVVLTRRSLDPIGRIDGWAY